MALTRILLTLILYMLTVDRFTLYIGGWWWWKGGCPTPYKKGGDGNVRIPVRESCLTLYEHLLLYRTAWADAPIGIL